MTRNQIFLIISILLFAIATFVALATATFKYDAALIPGGLLFFALAHLE
jgi:hypothetical protein